MKKTNIGIITQKLKNGGAERAAANLSQDLSKSYNVYLICFDSKDIAYEYSGELIDLNLPANKNILIKILNVFRRVAKVKKIKKDKKIDICISFMEPANLVNVLSKRKEYIITSERTILSYYFKRKMKEKFICKRADKIVSLSKYVKQDLIRNFNVDSNKIICIYNSCDKQRLLGSSDKLEEVINSLDSKKRYILTMGRLNGIKGQYHLIKAFKKVKEKINNVELLILGQGELEGDLKKLSKNLGLDESVRFLGYIKNPHKIFQYCDVFAFSSIIEGLGNVLLEALAFNKAIVSTDCFSGPREILAPDTDINYKTEIIEYAEYGVLVPSFKENKVNPDDISINKKEKIFAEAIIKILEDDELRKKYEEKAKERINQFSPEVIKKQWIEAIKSL